MKWVQSSSQDTTHYPSQAKHPHYIISTDLAGCSPACKHHRLAKVHLVNSSTFSADRRHKHNRCRESSPDWNMWPFEFHIYVNFHIVLRFKEYVHSRFYFNSKLAAGPVHWNVTTLQRDSVCLTAHEGWSLYWPAPQPNLWTWKTCWYGREGEAKKCKNWRRSLTEGQTNVTVDSRWAHKIKDW